MFQRPSGLFVTEEVRVNGHAQQQPDFVELLQEQMTAGYRPTLPITNMFNSIGMPQMFLYQDAERMLTHPVVKQALSYFKGGIAGAEFWGGPNPDNPEDENGLPICPENDKVGRFIKEHCERFWDRGIRHVQGAYEYGWIGGEHVYSDEDGVLKWEKVSTFAPSDTYLLTRDHEPVGIRVKNIIGNSVPRDLWLAGETIPAKGLWYAHQPRYNSFYGISQLLGAWRPWRRLAWQDGAETVLDGACYRFGYQGPIMRFPNQDLTGPTGVPNTTQNLMGQPVRYARDIMRQIGEQIKAGATVGLPSTRDEKGNYLYDIDLPTGTLAGLNNLVDYCNYLGDQITEGIGVPPELLEAAESGSGYSGRRIPLEAFLANQQQIADAILTMFVDQVIGPLVRFNFGNLKFNVQVKSLIKTRTKQAQAAEVKQPQPGQPQQPQPFQQQRQQEPAQHQNPQQAMFSQSTVTDRLREIARKIVRVA